MNDQEISLKLIALKQDQYVHIIQTSDPKEINGRVKHYDMKSKLLTVRTEKDGQEISISVKNIAKVYIDSRKPEQKPITNKKHDTVIQKTTKDYTFNVNIDEETGQTVSGGMGELHLDILVDR